MLGHGSIAITSDTYSHLGRDVGRQGAEAAMALVPRTGVPTSFPQADDSAVSVASLEGPASETPGQMGGPRGTRTHNPRIKSPLLCQLS